MKTEVLLESDLAVITGGKICSVFDIFCLIGEGITTEGRTPTPPVCSVPSAWNPAPPIRC